MKFEVTILGCGSATPTLERNPTAQFINVNERHLLIDCGEGTQMQLRKYKVRFQKISHIFISHLHGDHYLGLVGLLSSFHLLGRDKELHVFGPSPLKELVLSNLKASKTYLKYPLFIKEIVSEEAQVLVEDEKIKVASFPLKHRIACMGFRIDEQPRELNINKTAIDKYQLGIEQIKLVKEGKDIILANGEVIPNTALVNPPTPLRSYAFCSDTAYTESIVPHIQSVTALYHESTFLNDLEKRAKETFHSTAKQAATIAQQANVGELYLGHFSARYKDTDGFITEGQTVFPNCKVTYDGMTFKIV